MTHHDPRPRRAPLGVAGPLAVLVAVLAACTPAPTGVPSPDGAPTSAPATTGPAAPAPPAVPVVPATPPPPVETRTAPVRVVVPARSIDVPVDPVGVAEDGQMEIPPLAERGGWYRFGADPGDAAGTTVVAAHVDSVASAGTGPFVRLVDVVPGDEVQVVLADGSTRAYVVDAVTRFPKSEARWPDVFTRDGPPRLALVTCGGTFDRATRHYRDNVLVTATPADAG
ncbi:class F sortase [Cellulomonas sp. ACRRI]|uniref:class F sortase n=1 Tax=Cellulomonas sp. ACRRI TaxID=2918188 RepID=UPI001EF2613C|nr:class F sortase [Cellulomonas sp. ACRRI]MCG7284552.1 class F sortase [Cellulomonas sp. ACRRI]